jgi:tetratricopeptide (TPR) repeat protein
VHHRWYRLDLAAAAQRVEHAYLQDRANPDVVGVAADLARPLGRFDQAIEFAQYRLQLDPLDAVAYEDLAYAYPYAGKLDEALDALRTVLRLSPHYFMAHEGIGELLLQKVMPRRHSPKCSWKSLSPPVSWARQWHCTRSMF